MPAGAGLRAKTRHTFSRGFRNHGTIPLTTYLRNFKLGDYVDIKVNASIHKVCSRHARRGSRRRGGSSSGRVGRAQWRQQETRSGATQQQAVSLGLSTAHEGAGGSRSRVARAFRPAAPVQRTLGEQERSRQAQQPVQRHGSSS
jgi:ribosomal protein L21E